MVESFKIRAEHLKRYLKISVNLPKDYNNSLVTYPLILVFDGQLFYNFLNEETRVIETEKIISSISKDFICITLQSPTINEWRISELNPYYNGESTKVDTVLSLIYYDYIAKELLPLLKNRYRINNNIYLLGYKEGAISSLYMLYAYDEFKGAGIFSIPLKDCSKKLKEDLINRFTCKKDLFLAYGGLNTDTKDDDLFYNLCTQLDSLKVEKLKYEFYENEDNSYNILKNHLKDFFNFILP